MKFEIKHEIRGRIRIQAGGRFTPTQADALQYYMASQKTVQSVKVRERTGSVVICYAGAREKIIERLKEFCSEEIKVPEEYRQSSGRRLNQEYGEKLIQRTICHYGGRLLLPWAVRAVITAVKSIKYLRKGIQALRRRKMEVSVLDATAIAISMMRGNTNTASSIMFLLEIGEILEEWTHKKSIDDLANRMSLHIEKVWMLAEDQEVLVLANTIQKGDRIRVHMGNVIPFDGVVVDGEAMVNQASMTGESQPVRKHDGSYAYAGTVVEEGELTILVKEVNGSGRFDKIVSMIEESEKLKSSLESKAEHLADRLVSYTFLGTGLTYLLTRSVTKALSVLMVDFSCALKLAMPISVLSAIREASMHQITVKGGKSMEAMAEADTIVFDKTGTLTKAQPTVVDVIAFNGESPDELLRIAACLEEHFPHSMAKAVVQAAVEKNLEHEELHSKVEYIIAHGIVSTIEDKRVVIGSYHFVFEDENCEIPEGKKSLFAQLPDEYSHLYMAIDHRLAAVICIEDPLREEAAWVVRELKKTGISKIVMMTGDSERTAKSIAKRVGVDEFYAEVLPEEKAEFIERERQAGRKVIMIGDGINDSPALSSADVGIAINDGAEIAREIADIVIGADDLGQLLVLKNLSDLLMRRIHRNYRAIIGFNASLIVLGVAGILQPTMSALLHNTSTLCISLNGMRNLSGNGGIEEK